MTEQRRAPGWRPLPGGPTEPRSIREGLDGVVRHLGAPDSSALTKIFGRWSDLVGDGLAPHVRPVRLHDGDLVLEVTDGAWATEVRFFESELLRRLAAEVGEGVVTSVRVRVKRR